MISLHLTALKNTPQWPECLLIPLHAEGGLGLQGQAVDALLQGKIQAILKQKLYQPAVQTIFHITPTVGTIKLVVLIGADEEAKTSPDTFCRWIKQAITAVKSIAVTSIGICLEDYHLDCDLAWKVRKASEYALNATYRYERFKRSSSPVFQFRQVHFLLRKLSTALEHELNMGSALSQGMTLMRDLGHTPPNICNPDYLAQAAQEVADTSKQFSCKVLSETEIKKLKMGGVLAVSQGSAERPRFIILEYRNGPQKQKPIVLIGKGVCFDSGGLSLKQPQAMVSMKFDMGGAASLLGTAKTIALMDLPLNVVFLIPAVTNMPDQNAYRPDDVVTTMSGLTVEITNTDAEGRMILCDAITYARRYHPRYVIDVATLTGAIIAAMGHHRSGLFSNDDELAKLLFNAAEQAVDPTWRFPLDPIYYEPLKSSIADMVNAGEAAGARSITSACFLARFADELSWAHLDIAGIAIPEKKMDYLSGRPVPLLVEFLRHVAEH